MTTTIAQDAVREAVRDGDADALVSFDTPLNFDNNYPIREAARRGHVDVVRLLLEPGRADPTANKNEALRRAAEGGHSEVVQLLLRDGRADPAADDDFAIAVAAANGHLDTVRELQGDRRVDSSGGGNLPIQVAAQGGHAEIARLLIADPRVDPAADDNYSLREAAHRNHADVVLVLLEDHRVNDAVLRTESLPGDIGTMVRLRRAVANKDADTVTAMALALGDSPVVLMAARFAAGIDSGPMLRLLLRDLVLDTDAIVPRGPSATAAWGQYLSWSVVRCAWVGAVVRAAGGFGNSSWKRMRVNAPH